jgi:ankyrin repeat protein
MEACNFGHKHIVEILLNGPASRNSVLDLDAVNIRAQSAEDVARSRGHDELAQLIRNSRQAREHPEELPRLRELQEQVINLICNLKLLRQILKIHK